MTNTVKCQMSQECSAEVTHIDDSGFIYCSRHGQLRKQHRRCRKLRAHELRRVATGQSVTRY